MTNRRRLQNRIERLLNQYDREIERAFLTAIREKAQSINLRELANAIEARDFNRALRLAGLARSDLFPFDTSITNAYVAGGQTVPQSAPAFAASFGFDGRATRAEAWARSHVGGLVTNIVDEQLDMLRETIGNQLAAGQSPRSVAVQIAGRVERGTRRGGILGLDRARSGYLDNARSQLESLDSGYFRRSRRNKKYDGIVRRAITDGKGLSKADIERISRAYANNLLLDRATTIARTESITALRAGRREGIQQGIEAGAISPDAVKRRWDATLDSRTRPDHRDTHGQEVDGMDAPFRLPDGSQMLFPGDTSLGAPASQTVQCRCYDEYVVDWISG